MAHEGENERTVSIYFVRYSRQRMHVDVNTLPEHTVGSSQRNTYAYAYVFYRCIII